MKLARSEKNRWVVLGLLYLGGYLLTAVFLGVGDNLDSDTVAGTLIYGGMFVVSISLAFLTRRLTRCRLWWLLPLLLSPFSLAAALIVFLNVMLALGLTQI